MPIQFILCILLTTTVIPYSSSLRILGLFPHPGISHFNFFHPIMLGLAEAGHDVTVVSHFPDKNAPSNYEDVIISGEEPMVNSVHLEVSKKKVSFNYHDGIYVHFVDVRKASLFSLLQRIFYALRMGSPVMRSNSQLSSY